MRRKRRHLQGVKTVTVVKPGGTDVSGHLTNRVGFLKKGGIRIILAALLFTGLFLAITKAWRLNLYSPLSYWGDVLEMAAYFGRDYVFNDLRERFFAPFAPEHASSLRYVVNFLFQPSSVLFQATYFLTRDVIASLNLYYLLTFPLIFISAYSVYGYLKLAEPFRFGAASLYALMPFHFLRNVSHLMESSYFVVPLLSFALVQVFTARPFFHAYSNGRWRVSWRDKRDWLLLCVMLFLSSINEYHHLFFLMLLSMAALASSLQHRNFRILAGSLIMLAAAMLSAAAKMGFERVFSEAGSNLSLIGAPISAYGGAERWGLKLVQIILPLHAHPLAFFRHIRDTYDSAHEVNENATVALGLVGACGFVYLLVRGIYMVATKRHRIGILDVASFITMCSLVIATVGGIGTILATASAVLVGPQSLLTQVRCYNRIIVFIGFFSYFAAAVLVQDLARRASLRFASPIYRRLVLSGIGVSVFVLGLWDAVPFELTNSADGAVRYSSDKEFFPRIEAQMKPHSLIFQVPFNIHHYNVSHPGAYPYNYADGIRPYLNSQTLGITYGGDKGSKQVGWLEQTAALPVPRLLERLCEYGFSGILVHRKLFGTPEEANEFEERVVAALGSPLQESGDKDFGFARLDGFCRENGIAKVDLSSARSLLLAPAPSRVSEVDFSRESLPDFLLEMSGFSGREAWGRWTEGPIAKLRFKNPLPEKVTLAITANAFGPNGGNPVKVRVGNIEKTFVITRNTGETYRLSFQTDGRADTVEIIPPKPISPSELDPKSGDTRKIGLALVFLRIEG